jgi:hypothetical protein
MQVNEFIYLTLPWYAGDKPCRAGAGNYVASVTAHCRGCPRDSTDAKQLNSALLAGRWGYRYVIREHPGTTIGRTRPDRPTNFSFPISNNAVSVPIATDGWDFPQEGGAKMIQEWEPRWEQDKSTWVFSSAEHFTFVQYWWWSFWPYEPGINTLAVWQLTRPAKIDCSYALFLGLRLAPG